MTIHIDICTHEDLHPYECNHDDSCVHCARRRTDNHDPATCQLCDDEEAPGE